MLMVLRLLNTDNQCYQNYLFPKNWVNVPKKFDRVVLDCWFFGLLGPFADVTSRKQIVRNMTSARK